VAHAGYRATAIDLNDFAANGLGKGEGSPFDILSPSGFAILN
jgi:hypothetical protein